MLCIQTLKPGPRCFHRATLNGHDLTFDKVKTEVSVSNINVFLALLWYSKLETLAMQKYPFFKNRKSNTFIVE